MADKDSPAPAASSTRKRAEQLAEEIETRILADGWLVGEMIGSEAALMEEYNVSRGVLREAIRLLEHHGSAQMRRGPSGGLFITPPELSAVSRSAALYLRFRKVDISQLVIARRTLELNNLELVGQRIRDPRVISQLKRVLDAEIGQTTTEGSTRYLRGFHLALADIADNPVMGLFTEICMTLQNEFVTEAKGREREKSSLAEDAAQSHRAHAAIYEALINGDIERARKRMERHLDAIGRYTIDNVASH
jgi:DNA-binding FadR family transcriptional regulator